MNARNPGLFELQEKIRCIKEQIENELCVSARIDNSENGRNGMLLKVKIDMVGVNNLEVWIDRAGKLLMGIEVRDRSTSAQIKEIMKNGGHKIIKDQKNPRYAYDFQTFIDVYHFLHSHPDLEKDTSLPGSGKLFEYEYSPEKIARRYEFAIRNQDQPMLDLCRRLLDADRFDKNISVNKPFEGSYREHLVPCVLIHQKVQEMAVEGETTAAISMLIANHLKIAHILPDQAQLIDYELGLKTSMPEGWDWGDDVLARLNAANISSALFTEQN